MRIDKTWMVVGISWLWWIYLAVTSQMLISGDALGFGNLGEMLFRGDWLTYFTSGPNREPGYPLLVAVSLRLELWTGFHYQVILKIIQLCLLGAAQIMAWRWLIMLGVSSTGIMLALGYIGFSPALLNAALSVYSEILIIPLWMALILVHGYWWLSLLAPRIWSMVILTGVIVCIWLANIFIKAISWYVFWPYWLCVLALLFWKSPMKRKSVAIVAWILAAVMVAGCVNSYLNIQFRHNGSRMLTDRGTYLFYANTIRRTALLDGQKYWAGALAVPGEGLCAAFMSKENCWYWGIEHQDVIGFPKLGELNAQGLKGKQKDDRMFALGFEAIRGNPAQYVLFTFLESMKIFFWESTRVSFVKYTSWLDQFYSRGIVKNTFRIVPAALGLWAFAVLLRQLWRERRKPWDSRHITIAVFVLVVVFLSCFYALATLVIRYAFMLGPLWAGVWVIACQRRRIFQRQGAG